MGGWGLQNAITWSHIDGEMGCGMGSVLGVIMGCQSQNISPKRPNPIDPYIIVTSEIDDANPIVGGGSNLTFGLLSIQRAKNRSQGCESHMGLKSTLHSSGAEILSPLAFKVGVK
jgi:hypothetical protein